MPNHPRSISKVYVEMRALCFIIILIVGAASGDSSPRVARQVHPSTTTVAPTSTDSEDEYFSSDHEDHEIIERAKQIAELFPEPMTRNKTKLVLQKALDLLNKPTPSTSRASCRGPSVEQEAKNVLRALTGDPTIGSSSEDSHQSPMKGQAADDLYCEERVVVAGTNRRISLDTMERILDMYEDHCSERTIKAKYRWYDRKYIDRFRRAIAANGNRNSKREKIENYVKKQVVDARWRRLPVHEYHLKRWALDETGRIEADNFKASEYWVHNFKKRNGIVSRKITELGSRAMNNQTDAIAASRHRFLEEFSSSRHLFRPHMIWNTDQSGFRYEISNERTLSFKGERDTLLTVDSQNKNTHSYTIQPIISRDGKLIGKLLLCMKEDRDRFGPRVERDVRELERQLGNVHVVCSTSGKMSRNLIDDWTENVLLPAMENALQPCDGETIVSSQGSSTSNDTCHSHNPRPGPSWASKSDSSLTPDQIAIRHM